MDNVNISSSYSYQSANQSSAAKTAAADSASKSSDTTEVTKGQVSTSPTDANSAAVVYEKSKDTTSTLSSKIDKTTYEKLKADAEERTQALRSLVEKLVSKQSSVYDIAVAVAEGGLSALYKNLEVDEATRAQAQQDIAEDGYWGVEQTSDRIVSFAKALAGDDPTAAQSMLDAIKKGFGDAEKEWGEELPELSKKTMSTTLSKMDEWIASLKNTETEKTEE